MFTTHANITGTIHSCYHTAEMYSVVNILKINYSVITK